ncbi:DUF1801 domain-containing protein [Aggregatimonas sangjinii]|uniref:DUF1801 domain-containing protein n=1 Tax=Aggregatimonas sangjinii TaxID=2583587 RepID=A0A5B7SSA4_9FLAO|nr:DUF1801 domain-containing protein [Aggregatimonas sangjinii]QCW99729.1 DUF1801 domain-containing protein [Aggregatimonas sangjinii]
MAENKTKPTTVAVSDFLETVKDEAQRADSFVLVQLMKEVTGHDPVMWGPTIIGFGTYHYKYESGREGDSILTGFSPRSKSLSIYIMAGFERYPEIMANLGKYKTAKSCLYVKRLADIDMASLKQLITASYEHMNTKYNS